MNYFRKGRCIKKGAKRERIEDMKALFDKKAPRLAINLSSRLCSYYMEHFRSSDAYMQALTERCQLPEGFQVATTRLDFVPEQRPSAEPYAMDLALIVGDSPTPCFAGMFTTNRFPGAPVIMARQRIHNQLLQGMLINNRIANVGSRNGLADAILLTERLGKELAIEPQLLLSISTGIIGWELPIFDMLKVLPSLQPGLHRGSAIDVTQAIMTTDSYPKAHCAESEAGRIVAIGKGAGMIEPNLATMLIFILTDIDIERDVARRALQRAVEESFNAISVDGEQSTSDMALLMSSGLRSELAEDEFTRLLSEVCRRLAIDIVRNGEGTGHVIEMVVKGAKERSEAHAIGKAILNSPLVGTAIYGNDPNVGRIISAIGACAGRRNIDLDMERVTILFGEVVVFDSGAFRIGRENEHALSSYLQAAAMNPRLTGFPQHAGTVRIEIELGRGNKDAVLFGSDLSHEYIHINADYRT